MRAGHGLVRRPPDALFEQAVGSLWLRGHDSIAFEVEALPVYRRHYAKHEGATAFARQIAALDSLITRAVADDLPRACTCPSGWSGMRQTGS